MFFQKSRKKREQSDVYMGGRPTGQPARPMIRIKRERVKLMKKTILLILACMMAAMTVLAPCAAPAENYTEEEPPLLMSLTHNCKNTGRMLPEYFNPTVDSYILTVASWVSNPKFTLTANDPSYIITVNGEYVAQGVETQVAKMDDNPKQIDIRVSTPNGQYRDYTVFLQRRPSERRTRVSAGYINSINSRDNKWYIVPQKKATPF